MRRAGDVLSDPRSCPKRAGRPGTLLRRCTRPRGHGGPCDFGSDASLVKLSHGLVVSDPPPEPPPPDRAARLDELLGRAGWRPHPYGDCACVNCECACHDGTYNDDDYTEEAGGLGWGIAADGVQREHREAECLCRVCDCPCHEEE